MTDLIAMGKAAKAASRQLAMLTTQKKNEALLAVADEIEAQSSVILAANAKDIEDGRSRGLTDAMLDRLLLTEKRVTGLAVDTRKIVDLNNQSIIKIL